MSTITLVGAEGIAGAGHRMADAARELVNAVASLREENIRHEDALRQINAELIADLQAIRHA